MSFCNCPRCGERTLERLKSYSHCVECLYFEDYWVNPDRVLIEAEKESSEIEKQLQPSKENLPDSEPYIELIGA